MSTFAISNGCSADGTRGPFEDFAWISDRWLPTKHLDDLVEQLVLAGFDLGCQEDVEQSSLLEVVQSGIFRTLTALQLLLKHGANVNAVDSEGRGALHYCLHFSAGLNRYHWNVCRAAELPSHPPLGTETEDPVPSSDGGYDADAAFDDTTPSISGDESQDDASSHGDDDEDSWSSDDEVSTETGYDSWSCGWCGAALRNRRMYRGKYDDMSDYCETRDVDDLQMPEPVLDADGYLDNEPEPHLVRIRQRLKLQSLLEAGCDPNLLDNKGRSPSDYAEREGLWPQWEWALDQTGWRYNAATGKCERKITAVEEEDVDEEERRVWESCINLPEDDWGIGIVS
jgi:hypothetical protein